MQAAAEEIAQRPEEPCSNFAKSFSDCMSYNNGEPSQSAVKPPLHNKVIVHEIAGAPYPHNRVPVSRQTMISFLPLSLCCLRPGRMLHVRGLAD